MGHCHRGVARHAGWAGRRARRSRGGRLYGRPIGIGSEVAFDDPRLDDFASSLAKDTSALVLVGEKPTIADFGSIVEPLGGKVVKTDLDEKDVKAIRKALKLPG